jgi:hypothetical protein
LSIKFSFMLTLTGASERMREEAGGLRMNSKAAAATRSQAAVRTKYLPKQVSRMIIRVSSHGRTRMQKGWKDSEEGRMRTC